jgi:acetyl-CoA carboxylase biotin carboxyl carrier protein
VDLQEIKAIVDLMKKNRLVEFELEKDNVKIRLRRDLGLPTRGEAVSGPELLTVAPVAVPVPVVPAVSAPVEAAPPVSHLKEIKSPMVGTFYRSPSPEAASYVEIGQAVEEDTVVCIIEAMKVMNEIKAEVRGTIVEVLLENAKPVEFGKPLFRVKPSPTHV